MILHDYKCKVCGTVHLDCLEPAICCEERTEITFEAWTKVSFANGGRPVNERVNPNTGDLQFHGAVDDPLTKIEMGLRNNVGDAGIRTTTPDQRRYLVEKLASDGDSKKLREEVLTLRNQNKQKAKETLRKATSTSR